MEREQERDPEHSGNGYEVFSSALNWYRDPIDVDLAGEREDGRGGEDTGSN